MSGMELTRMLQSLRLDAGLLFRLPLSMLAASRGVILFRGHPASTTSWSIRKITMASQCAVDALPYIDSQPDSHLKQRIERMLAAEIEREESMSTLHPTVSAVPELFASNTILAASVTRAEMGNPPTQDGLDTKRYALSPPADRHQDMMSWETAVDNARVQLGHMALRKQNLDLFAAYGPTKWRIQNYLAERDIERVKNEIHLLSEDTEEVNRARKARQLQTGERLTILAHRWEQLIGNNLRLEIANLGLKAEMKELQQKDAIMKERLKALP